MTVPRRRLLLVSQRPLDYGGGGSVRWQFLRRALPEFGWEVHGVTAPHRVTANESATDPWAARVAAARARLTGRIGSLTRPAVRRLARIQPEALAPNGLWAWTGRGAIRDAIERIRPDVVWATGPPPSAMFAAAAVLRDRPEPLVAEFRDLWAGNPYFDAGGPLLPAIERRVLSRCAAVVSVTDGCRERLLSVHPEVETRFELLPNGFDPVLLAMRDARPVGSPATLVHAGTLYGDRSAVRLIAALRRPELRGGVRLELVGVVDAATEAAAAGNGDVTVLPPTSWEEAIARMRAADVAVVVNSPGTGGDMALPSKLFDALALGKPVLALTPPGSETERLLHRLGAARGCVTADDEAQIAAAIRGLLSDPPPAVDPAELRPWDRTVVAERLAALADRLAGARIPT